MSACLRPHTPVPRHTHPEAEALGRMICIVYRRVYIAQDLCRRPVCFAAASVPGVLWKHTLSRVETQQMGGEQRQKKQEGRSAMPRGRIGPGGQVGRFHDCISSLGPRLGPLPLLRALLVSQGTQEESGLVCHRTTWDVS